MRELPLAEAKARLSALIDEVVGGDEVVITRRGKAVVRIVAERRRVLPARRRPWVDALRRFVQAQPMTDSSSVIAMRAADRY